MDANNIMTNEKWHTVDEAAQHARCGKRSIYLAVQQGKLRAARLGGRRELRFLVEWLDAWLLASSTPEIVNPRTPGDDVARNRVQSPPH
jgi:excisionase family DNA binding protein